MSKIQLDKNKYILGKLLSEIQDVSLQCILREIIFSNTDIQDKDICAIIQSNRPEHKTNIQIITGTGWECTDIDTLQFCRKMDDKTFVYREFDTTNYNLVDELKTYFCGDVAAFLAQYWNQSVWIEDTMKLSDYTEDEMWNHVSSYYTRQEFDDMWENKNYQIMLECAFEIESGAY